MSAETKKILELVSSGRISAEDGEKLLEKLSSGSNEASAKESATDAPASGASAGSTKQPKTMRIVVERPGHEQINIRMPLAFTKNGARLMAVLPLNVIEKLGEMGIDMATLGEMTGAVEDMRIDVDKGNGKRVKIFCE